MFSMVTYREDYSLYKKEAIVVVGICISKRITVLTIILSHMHSSPETIFIVSL